ncbi:hypothetical protein [Clostridium saccharobutylicum]|uniref:Lipoprotein n=1 Tax=Clostridium saccharobutylicum DSM 13864 TaxID=1345695 RepID=U5MNA7_CLOSA|nr:hypothetical protein [Clostridium saccharobutylicum]AGX42294.1 hypothetical protein CLSA_c12910 [Clostridium saccharobutylicum DSM 13864]AQR89575.1 hypothetical protein CLOSC_12780 [Clostridium saccharobutylicum]AQR99477.1 hypothetical protein CSACC_12860 [Clostridium saccharobutylicum]AQS13463.1 hypothetical protein CLOSACC_12860 [Clostridium saccharobutylicum]MBA2904347.1 peptidoglycan hydrolase CwlO-like protein [Clostridium saccharobutylicum]
MKKKNIVSILMCMVLSFSLFGCSFKDDYIIQTKENTDEKPSGDKVNEVFNSEKMKDLMDKLKSTPKKISDKADEVDSDTTRMMNELNDKADELTDAINDADVDGKSEDIKAKFDDISDELDKVNEKVNDAKEKSDSFENPVDETKITDTVDEFTSHMNNLENALNRVGK